MLGQYRLPDQRSAAIVGWIGGCPKVLEVELNQRRIEAFRAVMNTGSITRAAEQLCISQPAVSRLIADLEDEIGFKLFERAGGKLSATEEAQSLIEDVDYFFRGIDKVYAAASDIKNLRKGEVRLGVMPNLSFKVVPRIVRHFVDDHPGVKFTMDVLPSPTVVNLVASRQFDLGLAQVPHDRPDINIIASYRMACVCVMSPDHRLASRSQIEATELQGEPMVALSQNTLAAQHVAQRFLQADVKPDIRIESQPSYAACALAAENLGVAIVDPLTVEMFDVDKIVSVPFVPEVSFDFRLFRAAHTTGNRASVLFAETAENFLTELPGLSRL
jgi:DNA-binding transcriptional LysR family regulator